MTEPAPPRSSTLEAIDAARWHLDRLHLAMTDEIAALHATIDLLRADNARLKDERDTVLAAFKDAMKGPTR